MIENLKEFFGADDFALVVQGFELLMSLEDQTIAAQLAVGVSLSDDGSPEIDDDAAVEGLFRNSVGYFRDHKDFIALAVLRAAGHWMGSQKSTSVARGSWKGSSRSQTSPI